MPEDDYSPPDAGEPLGADPTIERIRPFLRAGVRIVDIERESGCKLDRRAIGAALKGAGWYQKKDTAGKRRWYPSSVPRDHRLKGNSTKYGPGGAGSGQIDEQWVKTERDSNTPEIPRLPEDYIVSRVSTLVDHQGQVRAQWTLADKRKQDQLQQFYEAVERSNAKYVRPLAPISEPVRDWDDTCIVYPLGDPHIGMLAWGSETGEDFNLEIAERDLYNVVDILAEQAPASPRAILADVGDYFHADNFQQATPGHGHPLDCDSRLMRAVDIGFNLKRRLVDRLLQKHAKVEVVAIPGNHDPLLSRMMFLWMSALYEKDPRVTVHPNYNPFLYLTHGQNLWGFTHGDTCKPEDLGGIMAEYNGGQLWGAHRHRKWITGHVHHEQLKEYRGCTVETFNTLAARDMWHHSKGYRSKRFLSYIVFDPEWGERARNKVPLDMARWMKKG